MVRGFCHREKIAQTFAVCAIPHFLAFPVTMTSPPPPSTEIQECNVHRFLLLADWNFYLGRQEGNAKRSHPTWFCLGALCFGDIILMYHCWDQREIAVEMEKCERRVRWMETGSDDCTFCTTEYYYSALSEHKSALRLTAPRWTDGICLLT